MKITRAQFNRTFDIIEQNVGNQIAPYRKNIDQSRFACAGYFGAMGFANQFGITLTEELNGFPPEELLQPALERVFGGLGLTVPAKLAEEIIDINDGNGCRANPMRALRHLRAVLSNQLAA